MGAPAMSARIALGSLIIKEKLGLTDEETVHQIQENPYLQYFLGFPKYKEDKPFDPSMMVHFRSRFSLKTITQITEKIVKSQKKKKSKNNDDEGPKSNKGKLLIDASCAPADIKYPTDLSLLNEAREKAEHIINILYEPLKQKGNQEGYSQTIKLS